MKHLCVLFAASLLMPIAGYSGQPSVSSQSSGPLPPRTPRATAPIDLTGYWVALVTEEWRYRMVTPAKGDIGGIPVTAEAMAVADRWDPEADERAGEQCRSYGAPAIMRVPGRLHVTWLDDNTLQMETDAGMQKRLFRFGAAAAQSGAPPSWQGWSAAAWQLPSTGRPFGTGNANSKPANGTLKVVTTHLRPGYLRKNGVPFSEDATLTEYFNVVADLDGTPWMVVTTTVEDPRYLREPYLFSTHFRKQAGPAGWDPSPCSSTW